MWNQNNGNGQGYGQDDVYGRLNNTKEVGGARFPFIEDTGRYALCTLEEFQHSSDGPCARALFETIESRTGKHAPGSYVVKIWKLVKPPKFQGQNSDADQFADFCKKLKGAPQGYPIGNDIRVLMKERAAEQLARGTVIEAVAVPNKKGTWVNIYWNNVQQTREEIVARRQQLEAKGIPATSGNATGQFQGAPHPAQMSQQYPAQTQQYAPAQPPQQGWGQPQAQPAVAPPGGFLANVPTNGGNNGGNW